MVAFPGSSIRIRLLLLVVLAVIPMFLLNLYTAAQERREVIKHAHEDAIELARFISSVQQQQIEATRQFLTTLAYMVEETKANPGARSVIFARLLRENPIYDNLAFIDEDGAVRDSARPISGPLPVADATWLSRALQAQDIVLTDSAPDDIAGEPSLILCIPILPGAATVSGLVCAQVAMDKWLTQAVTHLSLPPDAVVTVLDRRGSIRARTLESEKWKRHNAEDSPIANAVLTQFDGMADGADVDGIPRIFGFTPMPGMADREYLSVGIRKDAVLAHATVKLLHNLLVLGFVSILMIIVAITSADLILLRRISPLISATQRIAQGDMDARTGVRYGRSELSQLARTFDQMADALQRRQMESEHLRKALQDAGRQFRAIFDNAFQFTAVLKPDGTLLEANQTALDFVGLTNDEAYNRPFWETPWWTVSPDIQEQLKEAVARAAKGFVVRYEVENKGIGDQVVTVDFSIKPLRDDKGEVAFLIAEGRDVTERKLTEAALKQSEARYRAIVEDQTELISRFSPDFEITFVNGAYCQYFNEDQKAFLGRKFWHHIPPEGRQRIRNHLGSLCENKPVATIEHRAVAGDGEVRWLKWTDRAILNEENKIVEYQAVGRDISDRKKAEESLRESERELRFLSSRLFTAQEDERKRIARELHDSTGQSLSAIKFGIEKAIAMLGKDTPPSSLQALTSLVPTVQYAMDELRKIMRDLRPSILDDMGLIATISWFCRDFTKIYSSLHIDKAIDIEEEDIPEDLKIVLFRILQEAMNNVAKHSKASHVTISLLKGATGIKLALEDNGIGFSVATATSGHELQKSFGFSGMRERVELTGGTFNIHSTEGKGTVIQARWPCIFMSDEG